MTPIRRTLPLLATATVLLAACGGSSSPSTSSPASPYAPAATTPTTPAGPAVPAAAAAKVAIKAFAFAPTTISVKVGGKVTFTNADPTAHTATADDGTSFDSGTLNQGQSKTITFTKAGTFSYHCAFHAFMTGKVVVS